MSMAADSLFSRTILRGLWPLDGWAFTCDPQLYEYNNAQSKLYCSTRQDCCTSMVLRPSSYAKLIETTTQPKQTNRQPNPNTTALRVIVANIYIGRQKK